MLACGPKRYSFLENWNGHRPFNKIHCCMFHVLHSFSAGRMICCCKASCVWMFFPLGLGCIYTHHMRVYKCREYPGCIAICIRSGLFTHSCRAQVTSGTPSAEQTTLGTNSRFQDSTSLQCELVHIAAPQTPRNTNPDAELSVLRPVSVAAGQAFGLLHCYPALF